jgi:hypothetical protein
MTRVATRRSRGPAIEVTFEDGSKSWYFSYNMAAYKQAIASGEFPLDRTFHTPPPSIKQE